MSIKTQHAVKAYLLFIVFIIILPKNTKYRYKILKKDQAKEPKEANKACVQDHLLKLCYLINNQTDIGNLTLSTHNLFETQKIIRIKIDNAERVSAKTRKKR